MAFSKCQVFPTLEGTKTSGLENSVRGSFLLT